MMLIPIYIYLKGRKKERKGNIICVLFFVLFVICYIQIFKMKIEKEKKRSPEYENTQQTELK